MDHTVWALYDNLPIHYTVVYTTRNKEFSKVDSARSIQVSGYVCLTLTTTQLEGWTSELNIDIRMRYEAYKVFYEKYFIDAVTSIDAREELIALKTDIFGIFIIKISRLNVWR